MPAETFQVTCRATLAGDFNYTYFTGLEIPGDISGDFTRLLHPQVLPGYTSGDFPADLTGDFNYTYFHGVQIQGEHIARLKY